MQPACASLSFVPGDTFTLLINLFTETDTGRAPLQMAPGEAFLLTLGRILASSADQGPQRLQISVTPNKTTFSRQFSSVETRRFAPLNGCPPGGLPAAWSFARVPAPGIHRTYAQGAINLVGPGQCGVGDRVLDLIVRDADVTIEIGGVPDVASYTDAREAAIRQDMAAMFDQADTTAAAYALLL